MVYCTQTAKDIVKLLPRPGIDHHFFLTASADTQFVGGTPSAGAQNTQGDVPFSIEIAIYLGDGTR